MYAMPRCLVVVRIPRSKTNKRGARERTRRPLDTFLAKFFCKSTSQFMVLIEVDERQQRNMLVSSRHVACVKIKKSALLDPLPIPPSCLSSQPGHPQRPSLLPFTSNVYPTCHRFFLGPSLRFHQQWHRRRPLQGRQENWRGLLWCGL